MPRSSDSKAVVVRRLDTFRLALVGAAVSITLGTGGCTIKPGGIAWIVRDKETYLVSTARGERTVTCEWFSHDSSPYWEPTTEETYPLQWVCDAIPRYWGEGSPRRTVVNPRNSSEVAHRQ
jgi:hypothetical protein